MDFLNKIGNFANKTYQKTSQKTGELAKEAKIKIKMNENKSKINDLYEEIGKVVYQKYTNKEELKMNEDLKAYCTQIDDLSKEIEKAQEEVLKLKNKRICENCYAEINLNVKYCPHCGFEQPEEKVEDVIEERENTEETVEAEPVDKHKSEDKE